MTTAEEIEESMPKGWFVLWCPDCFVSLSWTNKDLQTFEFDEWLSAQSWAVDQIEHDLVLHEKEKRARRRLLCPECVQGKHDNCTIETLDPETDDMVSCACDCQKNASVE